MVDMPDEVSRIVRLEDELHHAWTASQIKEYLEALLAEKDRALKMADDEREKAASALRGEQQRALDEASDEREKAAHNLRVELARAITEGDDRLREHITNQIVQIREALTSADKLEQARVDASDAKTESVRRELQLVQKAQEDAVGKAEQANEKRFDSVNEFRSQLSDVISTFVPREVFDTQSRRIGVLESAASKMTGALALIGILVPLLTALAVYLLTRHGIPVAPAQTVTTP